MAWLSFDSAALALGAVFIASFLAATPFPGSSEAALLTLLHFYPEQAVAAICLATAGNTLGGMSSYAAGRLLPLHSAPEKSALVIRRGPPVLLLAWLPVLGDLLCLSAGWLRLDWLPCALWMALGKGLRYLVVWLGFNQF